MKPDKPNIVFLICHDLGQQLGCYGDPTVRSPVLDELASQGALFPHYFGASTPCSPSRGCIMTGRYAHSNGLIGLVNRGWDLPTEERTIVDYLNEAGYCTLQFGLQHERKDPNANRYAEYRGGPIWCEVVADRVAAFLTREAADRQPFYLNAGFYEVHLPFDRPGYEPDDPQRVYIPGFLPDDPDVRLELARFHGAIKFMDASIGKILEALQASGLDRNTVVIFTTDHGMAFPRAKSTLYDPGIGTALIMRFPPSWGIQGEYPQLLSNIDLTPTLLEMVGAPVPPAVQGRSFWPLLCGGQYAPRTEIFSEKNFHDCYDPIRCIRTDRYKYIRSFADGPDLPLPSDIQASIASNHLAGKPARPRPQEELYDLREDPWEQNNLAGSPEMASIQQDLKARLWAWMQQTDDPILEGKPLPYPPEQPV